MTVMSTRAFCVAALSALFWLPAGSGFAAGVAASKADPREPGNMLAREVFAELVNINTTPSGGGSTKAAEAMARRFRAAGFAEADVRVLGPKENRQNLVVRLHGTGEHRPLLMIGHLDTVEATKSQWSVDPFTFTQRDGFFYGRGTIDMKNGDAVMVASLLRMKAAGIKPRRDIVLALTADEEIGDSNGVAWLLTHHRDLVDAEIALNMDDYSIVSSKGVPKYYQMEAAEKNYADFVLVSTNPGGHSSLPREDNAIYALASALQRISAHAFAFELNAVSRAYYERTAAVETGQRATDIHAILKQPADPAAIARLSKNPMDNATFRTTCVATQLQGGDQANSLPQRAEATINCRILPGHSPEEVRQELARTVGDPKVLVKYRASESVVKDTAPIQLSHKPSPLAPAVMEPLQALVHVYWPNLPVIPYQAAGGSDGIHLTDLGIPVYLITGFQSDIEDDRFHARDERIGIDTFYSGNAFFYEFLQELTAR